MGARLLSFGCLLSTFGAWSLFICKKTRLRPYSSPQINQAPCKNLGDITLTWCRVHKKWNFLICRTAKLLSGLAINQLRTNYCILACTAQSACNVTGERAFMAFNSLLYVKYCTQWFQFTSPCVLGKQRVPLSLFLLNIVFEWPNIDIVDDRRES